jgi:uncharacterized Zn finger protein (UPF0148 family)
MQITLTCPYSDCAQPIELPARNIPLHGGKLTCPHCRQKFLIQPRQKISDTPATVSQTSNQKTILETSYHQPINPTQTVKTETLEMLKNMQRQLEALQRELNALKSQQNMSQLQEQLASIKALLQQSQSDATPEAEPSQLLNGKQGNDATQAPCPIPLTIEQWFTQHNVSVKCVHIPSEVDEVFDELAAELGDKFDILSGFYEVIKKRVSSGSYFNYSLHNKASDEISRIVEFGCKLTRLGFLKSKIRTDNPYNRESRTINAAPIRTGKVINFFTGGWLERYVFNKIYNFLNSLSLDFQYILNPQIEWDSGGLNELDMIFMVNGVPFWVECKTNNFQDHIVKYREIMNRLALPQERAMLVMLGLSDGYCAKLTGIHGITFLNERSFIDYINSNIIAPILDY